MIRKIIYKIKLFIFCIQHGYDFDVMHFALSICAMQLMIRSKSISDVPPDLMPLVKANIMAYSKETLWMPILINAVEQSAK